MAQKLKKRMMFFGRIIGLLAIIGVIAVYFWNNRALYEFIHVDYQKQRTLAFYNEDSLISDLQKQGLWLELQNLDDTTSRSVPAIAYSYVPDILEDIKTPQNLKNAFVSLLLPLVLIANEEIRQESRFALDIQAKRRTGIEISDAQENFLQQLLERYKCDKELGTGKSNCLLARARPIPNSLALAQAAIESGWGSSRFARQGNAIYGQWAAIDSAQTIIAKETRGNQIIRLRAFDDLLSSVRAYMLNLNTHASYADFRKARLQYIKGSLPLIALLKNLEAYAEKEDYFLALEQIIQSNGLSHLERTRLRDIE